MAELPKTQRNVFEYVLTAGIAFALGVFGTLIFTVSIGTVKEIELKSGLSEANDRLSQNVIELEQAKATLESQNQLLTASLDRIKKTHDSLTLPYSRREIVSTIPSDLLRVQSETEHRINLRDNEWSFMLLVVGRERVSSVSTVGHFTGTHKNRGICCTMLVANELAPEMLWDKEQNLSQWFLKALEISEDNPEHTVKGFFGDVEVNVKVILKGIVAINYKRYSRGDEDAISLLSPKR